MSPNCSPRTKRCIKLHNRGHKSCQVFYHGNRFQRGNTTYLFRSQFPCTVCTNSCNYSTTTSVATKSPISDDATNAKVPAMTFFSRCHRYRCLHHHHHRHYFQRRHLRTVVQNSQESGRKYCAEPLAHLFAHTLTYTLTPELVGQ